MKFFTRFLVAVLPVVSTTFNSTSVARKPTVYLVRHGEKPKEGNGLHALGMQRAQCLREVFGGGSEYDIGHIMAQKYKKNGARKRPFDTMVPLARDLVIPINTRCDRDDFDCVDQIVKGYRGDGNILICWEHKRLTDIIEALGVEDSITYPREDYNWIWTVEYPYREITVTSQDCPGLDD